MSSGNGRAALAEQVWSGDGLGARLLRTALIPASWIFGAAVAVRTRGYDSGRSKIEQASAPVVSIGNLTVGGSGKTPLVLWLVEELLRRGLRPVVVSRGYGGTPGTTSVLVPQAALAPQAAAVAGDEAVLVARRAGVPVATAARRIDACRAAAALAPDLFILDDGFQHRSLARDLDIVVLTGEEADAHLLPAGPLREPVSALQRADVVIDAGSSAIEVPGPEAALRLKMRRRPLALVEAVAPDARKTPLEDLAGRRIVAAAGIGRPAGFFAMLEAAGAEIVERLVFPDHADYDLQDWKRIRAAALKADWVVVTEKDLVKLARFGCEPGFLYALRLGVEVEQGDMLIEQVVRLVRFDPRDG
ncbi:MAG: tetraacyldisaccharide 4'-kinase [Hyphomicrobiaceae bacterium]